MKKKWPIRILLVLLCVVMLCNVPAYAVETRASSRIAHSAVSLSKKSTGDLSVYFSVQTTDVMEKIGASSVEIQRSSGSSWATEYTSPATPQRFNGKTRSNMVYSQCCTRVEYRKSGYGLIGATYRPSAQTDNDSTIAASISWEWRP